MLKRKKRTYHIYRERIEQIKLRAINRYASKLGFFFPDGNLSIILAFKVHKKCLYLNQQKSSLGVRAFFLSRLS